MNKENCALKLVDEINLMPSSWAETCCIKTICYVKTA